MNCIDYGNIETMWALCGPDISVVLDHRDIDENGGPRCNRCKKTIEETGENTYCSRYTPIGYVRGEPSE